MRVNIYIFIFSLLSFGLIESKMGYAGARPHSGANPGSCQESIVAPGDRSLANTYRENFGAKAALPSPESKVVINEIMADPTPVVGLPDREFVELYNPETAQVNLKGWVLGLGSKQKIFPDVTIAADGYLLVTGTGGSKDLQSFGQVVEISGFSINNSGLLIVLMDPENRMADQLSYAPSLHKKGREDGGFTLERIDPGRICGQKENWSTSLSLTGGTPGCVNSLRASNADLSPPQILATTFVDNRRLDIQFSENFLFPDNQADVFKNMSEGAEIDSIKCDQASSVMQIFFHPESIRNGINYSMVVHGIGDECGNIMPDRVVRFGFYLPVRSDLLITEVLFNPYPEGYDFVEIYNNSGHEVDLSGLFLATRDGTNEMKQISQLSVNQQYLPAGDYLAVTKSPEGVLRYYRSKCVDCLLQLEKFPSLADQSGCVVLLNKNLDVIDEMNYDEEMHHPFITEKEGISLERINLSEPASQRGNWHSASKSSGFATPGYANSSGEAGDPKDDMVSIDPVVFSPNGDGRQDDLNIYLNSAGPDWLLNITILNCAGIVVRKLTNNLMISSKDQMKWDGLGDDFQKVQPGIYLLNISLFAQTGRSHTYKFACVLTDVP
jgi:hypothetical protein